MLRREMGKDTERTENANSQHFCFLSLLSSDSEEQNRINHGRRFNELSFDGWRFRMSRDEKVISRNTYYRPIYTIYPLLWV